MDGATWRMETGGLMLNRELSNRRTLLSMNIFVNQQICFDEVCVYKHVLE